MTFDPAALLAGQSFTVKGAGDDPAVDSDGDPVTGATDPIVLGPNSQDLNIDQGIVQAYTSVLLHKVVVDPTPSVPGRATEFPVTLTCTPAGSATPIVNEVVLSISGEEVTVDDIPVGAMCSVNETDANGAAVTIAPASPFVIGDTEPVSITVTNTYQPGLTSVDLRKVVLDPTPAATGRATEFPGHAVLCPARRRGSHRLPGRAGHRRHRRQRPGIYLGSTCSVTEDDTNGAQVTIDPEGDFVVGTEGVAVTVTNTYQAVLSSIELHKVIVDPNPADEHGDAETFPVTLTCTAPGSDEPVTVEVELPRDGTVITLTDVPVGTVCTAEETDTDGGVSSIDPAGEFVVGEQVVAITVTNTFPPPPPVTPSPSSSEQPPTSVTPTSPVSSTVSVTPTQGTAPVVPAPNPPKGTAGGGLAHTGVSLATWLTVAALLLGLGGAVMLQARRPRKSGLHS
ncbi:hypothetical protein H4P1_00024 (plasmid) [Variovorax sp. PBS-H4]|nr:hypothetical protein H4P1_00024 [Variovorax sp. PBS-H4]